MLGFFSLTLIVYAFRTASRVLRLVTCHLLSQCFSASLNDPEWDPFLPYRAVPPGRCAPRGEEVMKAPGLHHSFPARPDDPDERPAITQNGGPRLANRFRKTM